jgi:hypothetical protein
MGMTFKLVATLSAPLITTAAALIWSALVSRGLLGRHHDTGTDGSRDIRTW